MQLGDDSTLTDYNAMLGNAAKLSNVSTLGIDAKLGNNGIAMMSTCSVLTNPGLATKPSSVMTPRLAKTPCSVTMPRLVTTPRLEMTQRSSTTGFDLISEKIRAVHHAINPDIFLSNADNFEKIAINAAAAVGHKVKSSFTEGSGKRKNVKVNSALLSTLSTAAAQCGAISMSTTPMPTSAKQRNTGATITHTTTLTVRSLLRVSTTPASTMCLSLHVSTTPVATSTLRTILFNDAESMLIDQNIVPRHHPHRTLVLQPVYKQLPPEDIVCLKESDELIVVIPAITNKTDKDILLVLCK